MKSNMKKTWIICVNRAGAVLYEKLAEGELSEIISLEHLSGHTTGNTDIHVKPGKDATDLQTRLFLQTISNFLEHAAHSGRFDELILAAEPHMLGVLRKSLGHLALSRLGPPLHSELNNLNLKDLKEYLKNLGESAYDSKKTAAI